MIVVACSGSLSKTVGTEWLHTFNHHQNDLGFSLIPVPLGRKRDPFCSYIRKPITQKVKKIPNTHRVRVTPGPDPQRKKRRS